MKSKTPLLPVSLPVLGEMYGGSELVAASEGELASHFTVWTQAEGHPVPNANQYAASGSSVQGKVLALVESITHLPPHLQS